MDDATRESLRKFYISEIDSLENGRFSAETRGGPDELAGLRQRLRDLDAPSIAAHPPRPLAAGLVRALPPGPRREFYEGKLARAYARPEEEAASVTAVGFAALTAARQSLLDAGFPHEAAIVGRLRAEADPDSLEVCRGALAEAAAPLFKATAWPGGTDASLDDDDRALDAGTMHQAVGVITALARADYDAAGRTMRSLCDDDDSYDDVLASALGLSSADLEEAAAAALLPRYRTSCLRCADLTLDVHLVKATIRGVALSASGADVFAPGRISYETAIVVCHVCGHRAPLAAYQIKDPAP